MSSEPRIDKIARGLAGGMSRRDALRAGGAMLVAGLTVQSADAWGASGGCPKHKTKCKGKCVDTRSDKRNCGRCGHACRSGQVCSQGRCMSVNSCRGDQCASDADCCSSSYCDPETGLCV